LRGFQSPVSQNSLQSVSIPSNPYGLKITKQALKGWRLEWFIVENHGKSLPPRSGRQPDVRTPSWIESPTALEVIEARVLLAEVCLLKERGLTTEAVVADFVFKNIQP
jgi:hypothetical protein